MANMITQEPAARVAPPERACPDVHPRAMRAPDRKTTPPRNAISQRVRSEMCGPFVVSNLARRKIMPEATYLAIKKYLTPTSEDAAAEAAAAKNRPAAPMWDDRGRININVASHEQLAAISGIGAQYADKIILARPFTSLADVVSRRVMPADAVNALYDKIFAQ